ncbi:hypothetical protein A6E21_13750 [Bacillus cereus]|nr:hypothetical protein A6E21_13750 [Bacillus cereus]
MFNTNELQDKIGYERWLLKDCTTRLEYFLGIPSSKTITFKLSGTRMHHLFFKDSFGQQDAQKVIENLSPLIFVTTYKCLDMIFEWILENNFTEVPYQFTSKIKTLKQNKHAINLPNELKQHMDLYNIYLKIYDKLKTYRNSIIHGNWGDNINGNLSFNFTLNNKTYEKNIIFKEVINLAESVLLLTELLINKKNIEYTVTTMKFLLDNLTNIHLSPKFNVKSPLIFKVIYEIGDTTKINLDEIRDYLKEQSFNHPFYFSLILMSETQKWDIPSKYLQNQKEICIDSSIQKFKI